MTSLILILLVVGFALLLVIPYLTRETRVGEVEVMGGKDFPAVDSGLFLEHVRLLTRTTLYDGNRVDILLNGDETYDRIIEDLERAKNSISWHVFFHRQGKLSDRIREVLIRKAQEGVRVNFLYDYFGADGLEKNDYLQGMRDAGVEVEVFRPIKWNTLYKAGQRMHIRAVLVDGKVAFTGGFGIADRWLGDGHSENQWRDTNVRIEGSAVDQLQAAFVVNWAEATASLLIGEDLFDSPDEEEIEGDETIGILHTDPAVGSTNGERFFILSIAAAREKLWITSPYYVPDDDFRNLLCVAADRGVDIRILTPGWNTDQKAAYFAGRAHYAELMEKGIRFYDYQPTMVHAKTMVVDGTFGYIGTMNFDNRSMLLNDEVAMIFTSRRIGTQLEQIFLDDLDHAKEIDPDEFARRPLWEKGVEQAARTIAHIL